MIDLKAILAKAKAALELQYYPTPSAAIDGLVATIADVEPLCREVERLQSRVKELARGWLHRNMLGMHETRGLNLCPFRAWRDAPDNARAVARDADEWFVIGQDKWLEFIPLAEWLIKYAAWEAQQEVSDDG